MPVPETADRVDPRSRNAEVPRAESPPALPSIARAPDRGTVIVLTIVLVLVWVLALYSTTTLSMVSIWMRSETFAHGFLVVPIVLFLLWRQREMLAEIETRPFFPALVGIAAAGFIWLVGEIVNAVSVAQFAMIAMVPLAVWGLLGTRLVKELAIPLAFLFFAVPFGEFLLPTMIEWTADFTVFAVRASGVPVFREGNFFTIPTGRWSVVEACSGLRYLIASFMVGCVYAYLSYRSTGRRIAFIAVSLLVPIVANWLRAYMIVMVGHLTNNQWAVGLDHLVYGWVFFGAVMLLLYWIGSHWREDEPVVTQSVSRPVQSARTLGFRGTALIALLGAVVLTAIWPPLNAYIASIAKSGSIQLKPIPGRDGWDAVSENLSSWRPDISGARTTLVQTFGKGDSRVGLIVAAFRDQSGDAKAVTSQNQVVRPTNIRWRGVSRATVSSEAVRPFNVNASVVADNRDQLAVWQWFWVDGRFTANEYAAKLYEVLSVLRGHGDTVAWVVVYTPVGYDEAKARDVLRAFTSAFQVSIDDSLRDAASK